MPMMLDADGFVQGGETGTVCWGTTDVIQVSPEAVALVKTICDNCDEPDTPLEDLCLLEENLFDLPQSSLTNILAEQCSKPSHWAGLGGNPDGEGVRDYQCVCGD